MRKGFLVVATVSVLAGAASSGAATIAPRGGDPASEGSSFPTPGTQDTFIVPAGVRSLSVVAVGGEGGDSGGVQGGQAAQVAAPLTVGPGDVYQIKVAALGTD